MAMKRAGMVNETSQADSGAESELSPEEKLISRVYGIREANGRLCQPAVKFEPGEMELIKIGLLELTMRRGRKLVSLCRYAELGLLTTDPIPRDLAEPASVYLKGDWLSLISAFIAFNRHNYSGYGRATEPEPILIDVMASETWKLDHLLRYQEPNGRCVAVHETDDGFDIPEIEHDDITPRNALHQVRKVADFIESCLKFIETIINQSAPQPLNTQELAAEKYVAISKPRPIVPDTEFTVLMALYFLRQPFNVRYVQNKVLELDKYFNKSNVSKYCSWLNKQMGFAVTVKKNWSITDSGIAYVENDLRFTSFRDHSK